MRRRLKEDATPSNADANEISIPHDPVNEQIILAAACLDVETRLRLVDRVQPDAMFVEQHRIIWNGIRELTQRKLEFDLGTLQQLVGNKLDVSYLTSLMQARPRIPENLNYHLDALMWDRQRAIATTGPISMLLHAIRNPREAPERVRALARAVGTSFEGHGNSFLIPSDELVRQAMANISERLDGHAVYPFGIEGLDLYLDSGRKRMIPGAFPGGVTVVTGTPGCLAGETIIEFNRARISQKLPISEFVRRFNGGIAGGKRWRSDIPTTIRARATDGFIRLMRVKDAFPSGTKVVFKITTSSGRSISATQDHRFLSNAGWKTIRQLTIGTQLWLDGGICNAPKQPSKKGLYKDIRRLEAHPFASRKNMRRVSNRHSVPVHRIVAEARENGLPVKEFIARIRANDIIGLKFIDPKLFTVHHRDEDPTNNEPSNLEVFDRLEHYRQHGVDGGWQHVTARTVLEEVVSIERIGSMLTFDIEMEGEPHNFLANGFVVHNSGKSTTVAHMALGIARQERRVLYGAWEMQAPMTLELMACISLGWNRSDLYDVDGSEAMGRDRWLTPKKLVELEERMHAISEWVCFMRNPFRRRTGQKITNEHNLDVIQEHISDSGCEVFIGDLWFRALKDTSPDEEQEALFRQQAMVEEMRVHAILVQQQRMKDIEQRADKRPTREGIKGSGAWTEVADNIVGVHRPALWKRVPDDVLEMLILKQRFGKWPLAIEFTWNADKGSISGGVNIEYDQPGEAAEDSQVMNVKPSKRRR